MEGVKIIRAKRQSCEVFSRSMGYIRPIENFNTGKRAEFEERKTFTETNSLKKLKKNRKTDKIK